MQAAKGAVSMVSKVEPLTKAQIRSKILLKLKRQKEDTRDRKSRLILKKLFRTREFIRAKTVMFYIAFGGEVNTREMIKEAQNLGKIVTVPVVRRSSPLARSKVKMPVCKRNRATLRPSILYDNSGFKKGPYGVCEPSAKRFIRLRDLGLVIVPGVAFDKKGNRLGRGKGCYDHFLKRIPKDISSIGLAFDFQILPSIPATALDVSVDKIIFA